MILQRVLIKIEKSPKSEPNIKKSQKCGGHCKED